MPLPAMRSDVRRFWEFVGQGTPAATAGVLVGVSEGTGWQWLADAGGVKPRFTDPRPGPRPRLTLAEREDIAVGVARGDSIRSIARQLGRAPATIMREIANNGPDSKGHPRPARYRRKSRFGAPQDGRSAVVNYRPSLAQKRSDKRARRPKPAKLAENAKLHEQVQARLTEGHSPEQISSRLRLDFPDDLEMRVSHETIYQSIYVQGRGALRRELHKCLRTGRALRKPQRSATARRNRILDMVSISERPPEVDDRAVPGHWEGDLIVGQDNGSAIGTLVERTTGFVMLLHLPDNHGALAVQEQIIAKTATLPDTLCRTLTWDQGIEMANHVQIAAATELDIYFCDPRSPWQRGTNENTNGLLRQYFPKSTDLSIFPADYLDYIAVKLNNRPRKRLDWKTPAEALDALLSEPFNRPGVAMTA